MKSLRMHRILFVITLVLLLAAQASAQAWHAKPKTHEEVFRARNGGVLKHFVFTFTLSVEGDQLSLREEASLKVDKFAGVGGEISFAGPYWSMKTMEVTLSNGSVLAVKPNDRGLKLDGRRPIAVRTTHEYRGRKWSLSWSVGGDVSPRDRIDHLTELASSAADLRDGARRELYRENRAHIAAMIVHHPMAALYTTSSDLRLNGEDAAAEVNSVLADLARVDGKLESERAKELAGKLVAAMAKIDADRPDQPTLLYQTAKQLERLNKIGLSMGEYMKLTYGEKDPAALKFFEKAINYVRSGDSLAAMARTGEINVDRFIDDTIKVIPKELVPALASPTGVFFRDTLKWNEQMWSETTSGLDIVSNAIETGRVDTDRLNAVTGRLQELAREGPWNATTGKDFVKKVVEGIPVIGKLLSALW